MFRANTANQFVVTGPLPCLKGQKMTFMKFDGLRKCTQCFVDTRVGILYVHAQDKEFHSENHFLCERCGSECLANLPPTTICPTCFRVPYLLFISPPMRSGGISISEGFRR